MTSNAEPRNPVANVGKVKFLSRLNGFNISLGLVVAATICTLSFVGLRIDRDMSQSSERLKATLAENQEAIRSGRATCQTGRDRAHPDAGSGRERRLVDGWRLKAREGCPT